MSLENEPILEIPFTYLLPMRRDNPAFADFSQLDRDVSKVMGDDYPLVLVTRVNTMLAGNGLDFAKGITLHSAWQESGRVGSVKAVTFQAPLSVERISSSARGIGPVAARALVEFAVRMQVHCETPQR